MTLRIIATIIVLTLSSCSAALPIPPTDANFTKYRQERSKAPTDVEYIYIYDRCDHKGDNVPVRAKDYVFGSKPAVRIFWNHDQKYKSNLDYDEGINQLYRGFSKVKGIFDCTLTVKLGTQDSKLSFQQLMYGSLAEMFLNQNKEVVQNVSASVDKLDPENTLANKGLKELQEACKDAGMTSDGTPCKNIGCIIYDYNNTTKQTCKWAKYNLYNNNQKWYTRDDIRIRILFVGQFVGRSKTNELVEVHYPPYYPMIVIDITKLYAGPCGYKTEFNCLSVGVCIPYTLVCDSIGMRNCPTYDEKKYSNDIAASSKCSKKVNTIPEDPNMEDPDAMQSLIVFWSVLGVLLGILTLYLLNFLFWRPGYIVWRCGRLRNCCRFGNCCFKLCYSSSKADCCNCCKTQGTFDTTDTILEPWGKIAKGDGFHMRENR